MRVLQLGPYPPPHGGVQTNLVAIRRFLLARGISCTIINLTRFRRSDADGVHYPKNARQVLSLLLRLPSDIVHLHIGGNLSRRLLWLALFCCLLPHRKAVLTFHSGGYPTSEAGRAAHPRSLRGLVMRRFDRVIAVNREIADLFHRLGLPPERVRLIPPHAILDDLPDTPLSAPLTAFFRQHKPVLVTVGLLEPEYDLSLQIVALGLVRERFPDAGLVIIGSGSLEAKLRGEIRHQLHADAILLCGDVPHPVTLRAIAESDVLLRTTWYDGDSISVREALHLGTPVIATDNGKRPEGVDLIPRADLAALRLAIDRRLTAPVALVAKSGGDEGSLQATLSLYRELMARCAPSGSGR